MAADDGCHIQHTAVATFDVIPVEQLMVPMVTGKVLIYNLEELLGNVGSNNQVVWWVEADDITFTLSLLSLRWLVVLHIILMSTLS